MSGPSPRRGVLQTAQYVQGASTASGPGIPIKLSSNESPLGPSPRAIAAYQGCAQELFRYPDGAQTALRSAIAETFDLEAERVVCGNGSDQLIELAIRAYAGPGDRVIVTQHSFAMARTHALVQGTDLTIAAEPNYRVDVDTVLAAVDASTRLVILASPNNPCGTYLPRRELTRLHAGLREDILLLVDAAYADYVVAADYDCGFELARRHGNVLVTRTFSKLYGLAALRIGWAYGAPDLVATLNRIRTPFNCNAAAMAAATAGLRDRAHTARVREHNLLWLERMTQRCQAMGLSVVPSVANFILVNFPEGALCATHAYRYLLSRGVIPRPIGTDQLDNCLRITIGLDHENEAALAALGEFMGQRA